jgi:lipid-binding SYLF domain-containing protein
LEETTAAMIWHLRPATWWRVALSVLIIFVGAMFALNGDVALFGGHLGTNPWFHLGWVLMAGLSVGLAIGAALWRLWVGIVPE